MTHSLDGPGSSSYLPVKMEPDDAIVYSTRSTRGANATTPPETNMAIGSHDLTLPDPAVGGERGPFGVLGWSTGFGMYRRTTPFTGRNLRVSPPLLKAEGHVGFSTRSQRLRNGVEALQTDYTPSSQEAAREIVENL